MRLGKSGTDLVARGRILCCKVDRQVLREFVRVMGKKSVKRQRGGPNDRSKLIKRSLLKVNMEGKKFFRPCLRKILGGGGYKGGEVDLDRKFRERDQKNTR